jgi:hypothetical protein
MTTTNDDNIMTPTHGSSSSHREVRSDSEGTSSDDGRSDDDQRSSHQDSEGYSDSETSSFDDERMMMCDGVDRPKTALSCDNTSIRTD